MFSDFDDYIARTKQELESMSIIKTEINDDLDKIDKQIQGIHVQVDDALNTAQILQTSVAFYDEQIKTLKNDVRINFAFPVSQSSYIYF